MRISILSARGYYISCANAAALPWDTIITIVATATAGTCTISITVAITAIAHRATGNGTTNGRKHA